MGVRGKLEVEVETQSGGDILHEVLSKTPHHVAGMSPEKVHAVDLHEGEFGNPGYVITWTYSIDGKKLFVKDLVHFDEEKKFVSFKVLEGNLLEEYYKSLVATLQVIPNGIKWTIEFEKLADDGPYPTNEADFLVALAKDIVAHHAKQN